MSDASNNSEIELSRRILEILAKVQRPLLAREIADELVRAGVQNVDRKQVNSLMYGSTLKPLLQQDRNYRWSLRSSGSSPTATASPQREAADSVPADWPFFRSAVEYYRSCVREDEGEGARYFLSDLDKRYVIAPLNEEWGFEPTRTLSVDLATRGAFAKQMRQSGPKGTMLYGYPLYVDWRKTARWSGGFAVPMFLQTASYVFTGGGLQISLESEWPRLNPDFVKVAFASLEERRAVVDELGLDEGGELPENGLADIVRRLADIGFPVDAMEPIDPTALDPDTGVGSIDGAGLYNRAVLVPGSPVTYAKGLLRELEQLSVIPGTRLDMTALRQLFVPKSEAAESGIDTGLQDKPLFEVVPLNERQREAVRSAFERPFTVVTGPPGTGKSQVVLSVLANSYLRGERVLFTSRNNKAVDVVETRLNGLSGLPLVLRTGSRSGDRDLRQEVLGFIQQALSIQPSDDDRGAEAEARENLARISGEMQAKYKELELLRQSRNEADQKDRALQVWRDTLGEEAMSRIAGHPPLEPSLAMALSDAVADVDWLAQPSRGLFDRLKRAFGTKRRVASLQSQLQKVSALSALVGDRLPDMSADQDYVVLRAWLGRAQQFVKARSDYQDYSRALDVLRAHGSVDEISRSVRTLQLAEAEWGERLIAAYGRLLPDRLDDDSRRALGQYRSTMERLSEDSGDRRAIGKLMGELKELFDRVSRVLPIWCVTNLSVGSSLPMREAMFDLVVIDEASQCDIPSALPLMFRAKRMMIIGDPQQLRHISTLDPHREHALAAQYGMDTVERQPYTFNNNSLFDLAASLVSKDELISLQEHFRSHSDIIEFSNRNWYRGSLQVYTDYRKLKAPKGEPAGVQWVDVKSTVQRATTGVRLPEEAERIAADIVELLEVKQFPGTIGVVAPFRAQANRIYALLEKKLGYTAFDQSDLIVQTVHAFQGDERDIIFFSACVSDDLPKGSKYFLASSGNLFNVAISRARAQLRVYGDRSACAGCGIPHVEGFADYYSELETRNVEEPTPVASNDSAIGFWEKPFAEALERKGIHAIPQYPVHQYRLDFAVIDGPRRLDIEIDGELYHREWDGTRARRDVVRDIRLMSIGWDVMRFWAYEVRDDMESCVQKVEDWLGTADQADSA